MEEEKRNDAFAFCFYGAAMEKLENCVFGEHGQKKTKKGKKTRKNAYTFIWRKLRNFFLVFFYFYSDNCIGRQK